MQPKHAANVKPGTRRPTSPAAPTAPALDPELLALVAEEAELESQGKLDAQTKARLEARMDALFQRQRAAILRNAAAEADAAVAARLTPPPAQRAVALAVLAALAFVLGGLALEATIGRQFIAAFSNPYRSAMPALFAALLLPCALAIIAVDRRTRLLRGQATNRWRWWLMVMPVYSCMFAGLALPAPLGWAALAGRVAGTPAQELRATVVSVAGPGGSWPLDCRQTVSLELPGSSAKVCLDGRISGAAPGAGSQVVVTGRTSWLGVYIDQMRAE
jgi:hypothetical protein